MADLGGDLEQLERKIERMRIDFERFFSGAAEIHEPESDRERIREEIRSLHARNFQGAAEQFRLGTLEARFNSYSELINRRLRNSEDATQPALHRAPASASDRGGEPILCAGLSGSQAIETLYRELYRSQSAAAGPDLATFRRYLEQQVADIRRKTGCHRVEFRVVHDAAAPKPKLKARPVS